MVTILIADDSAFIRSVLRSWLEREPDFRVVGEVADGDEALRLARKLGPNILLADINMPGPSGIEIAAALHNSLPNVCVIVVSSHEDASIISAAMAAGAAAFVSKRMIEVQLIPAIREALVGIPHPRDDGTVVSEIVDRIEKLRLRMRELEKTYWHAMEQARFNQATGARIRAQSREIRQQIQRRRLATESPALPC